MDVVPLSFSGTAPIQATFVLQDNIYFSDALNQIEIPVVPPTSGGLVAPLVAPLMTGGVTTWRTGSAVVGGSVPTPVSVAFYGPITRPWVRGNGWFLQYDYGLAADQVITVSTMHHIAAFDNFGRNLTGKLSPKTKMSNVRMNPGNEYITFGGSDITGTAKAVVSWRNAYTML